MSDELDPAHAEALWWFLTMKNRAFSIYKPGMEDEFGNFSTYRLVIARPLISSVVRLVGATRAELLDKLVALRVEEKLNGK